MIKLIVALGNPGAEYELTRHNVAWLLVDTHPKIAENNWKTKFKGEYTDFSVQGEKVYVLKPQTYMNLSGESVQPLCQFFKIDPREILVVQDELDLPFGQIHFKQGGGLAGHNGLKSIAKHLGTQDFMRMRIGIGRPPRGSVSNWVLSKFPAELDTELGIVMEKSNQALDYLLENGFKKASNTYNKKDFLALN
ncbi:MAG: aminoacyl-tRNA hydrolase [Halobacteriovoraceae bacterium]|nr:aminoacyl-tRNA hydrolase [Halobacteriovoraceae bacterium]|tara:strand:- start:27366 stop:27944 length:579 start_codon:yes stop_codon:yes gene_type:complete